MLMPTSRGSLGGLLANEVAQLAQIMEDVWWILSSQWLPGYSSIAGNERAGASAAAAHIEEQSMTIQRVHDARCFIRADDQ